MPYLTSLMRPGFGSSHTQRHHSNSVQKPSLGTVVTQCCCCTVTVYSIIMPYDDKLSHYRCGLIMSLTPRRCHHGSLECAPLASHLPAAAAAALALLWQLAELPLKVSSSKLQVVLRIQDPWTRSSDTTQWHSASSANHHSIVAQRHAVTGRPGKSSAQHTKEREDAAHRAMESIGCQSCHGVEFETQSMSLSGPGNAAHQILCRAADRSTVADPAPGSASRLEAPTVSQTYCHIHAAGLPTQITSRTRLNCCAST